MSAAITINSNIERFEGRRVRSEIGQIFFLTLGFLEIYQLIV